MSPTSRKKEVSWLGNGCNPPYPEFPLCYNLGEAKPTNQLIPFFFWPPLVVKKNRYDDRCLFHFFGAKWPKQTTEDGSRLPSPCNESYISQSGTRCTSTGLVELCLDPSLNYPQWKGVFFWFFGGFHRRTRNPTRSKKVPQIQSHEDSTS